ncbi:MAG: C40 family peptidase [Filimonas sp.]|nr:C40 family peptidase [Filimonas sp.]
MSVGGKSLVLYLAPMLSLSIKKLVCACFTLAAFASCKSIKNVGSKDNSTAKKSTPAKKSNSKDVKFIDGIAVTPGNVVTSKHNASTGKTEAQRKEEKAYYTAQANNLTNFNIEKADWLQLKYAIVLDASVEKMTNLGLLRAIDYWWGTRYCLGGSTTNCVDCSAFTLAVMRDVYNVPLARTAQEQYNNSDRVEVEDLKEGDLVFFHTSGRSISHVGIYVINNKFVHAATSGGVMVSDLNDKYWQARYKGAGRVIK